MKVLNMDIYLANLSKRYKTANKHEKGLILNELCEMGGFHKKHAIRLLNKPKKKQKPRINIGRPNLYPAKLYLEPLKRIWLSSDQPCGKRSVYQVTANRSGHNTKNWKIYKKHLI